MDNSVYTEEERKRLEDNYNYRSKMVQYAFSNGQIPEHPKEIEAINSVLNSMDKAIVDAATNRLKQQETMNKDATLNIVSDMIKAIHKQQLELKQIKRSTNIEDEYIPTDIVTGEKDIIPENITLDDIMNASSKQQGE